MKLLAERDAIALSVSDALSMRLPPFSLSAAIALSVKVVRKPR